MNVNTCIKHTFLGVLVLVLIFVQSPVAVSVRSTNNQTIPPSMEKDSPPEERVHRCSEEEFREFGYRLENTSPDQIREKIIDFYSFCGLLDKVDFDEVATPPDKGRYDIDYSIFISHSKVSFTPGEGLGEFLLEFVADKPGDFIVPVIIQKRHFLSLNEGIEILEHGVSYYTESDPLNYKGELGESAFLSSVSKDKIEGIIALNTVKWIGLYKPAHKYFEIPVDEAARVSIKPLGAGIESYLRELEQLGIREVRYFDSIRSYSATISTEQFLRVANLLWVKYISIMPEQHTLTDAVDFNERPQNYKTDEITGLIKKPEPVDVSYAGKPRNVAVYLLLTGLVIGISILVFWYMYRGKKKRETLR